MTQAEIEVAKSLREEMKPLAQELDELGKVLGPLMQKRDVLKSSLKEKQLFLEHLQDRCEKAGHVHLKGGTALIHVWHDARQTGYECEICGKKVVV